MSLVLAIEPDLRQAAIVKRVINEKVQADVAVVDSRDAAIEAIRARTPDVLLLSALLSPRDEQELMAHLRTLVNAEHLQTHTIPQLASSLQRPEDGQGLLGRFRRKKAVVSDGCDPDVFADEVRMFLERAEEKKRERELFPQRSIVAELNSVQPAAPAAPETAPAVAASSWDSPFEWPSGNRESVIVRPQASPESTSAAEPLIAARQAGGSSSEPLIAPPEPLIASAESAARRDSGVRFSDLLSGSPVSSINDRVEFPSAAEDAPVPERAVAAIPEALPEPPPDTLAPFLTFDRARGLRRDAARWLRVDAAETGTRRNAFSGRDPKAATADFTDSGLAMTDPVRVRIRTIRVQPAA